MGGSPKHTCLLITGPRSASLTIPELTTRPLARLTNSSSLGQILVSCATSEDNTRKKSHLDRVYHDSEPPTKTAVLNAMHLCPAAPNPAAIRAFNVASLSASGRIIA
jgi:hypothetical protein